MTADELIMADSSVWIDHLDHNEMTMRALLEDGRVLMHPFVIGELAMGNLKRRGMLLGKLQELPGVDIASEDEILSFVLQHALFGRGIGYIDAHLLAAVRLTDRAKLWTRDRNLRVAAQELGLDFKAPTTM